MCACQLCIPRVQACQHKWSNRGHADDPWRECHFCGQQEDYDWTADGSGWTPAWP